MQTIPHTLLYIIRYWLHSKSISIRGRRKDITFYVIHFIICHLCINAKNNMYNDKPDRVNTDTLMYPSAISGRSEKSEDIQILFLK